MSIYEKWKEIAFEERDEASANKFWKDYCEIEKGIYEAILHNKEEIIQGSIKELADKYKVEPTYFMGFLDGINESIYETIQLEELTEISTIDLRIDFEKLYYNMHEAKAHWLYNLQEWDNILTEDRRKEIKKEYNLSKTVVREIKIGRNEPCICGSEKKYKKCCGK
ncbi:SEC-C domain-containing protein [Alkaliphilus pronyensis]|uniref:SEC-C domain-containing protein n=1 Tax=Alkaliphilus pronyensis TaxID=1482732 RepID=A0A6I0FEW5_9FIRM|nr:SEC-C metal-binding domain-containing protein [Alkaliphilus pronyensis]KAB3540995.1 SEC-C domain-containing protein [Alkaliphilus pronyensis]